MEFTDTMPYDGDEAAWQGWQVSAPTEPVPAMGVTAETQLEEEEADPNAAAPTLAYDTAGEFVANAEHTEEEEADPAAVAPTLAYDTAGEFVINETQHTGFGAGINDTLAYEVHSPGGIPHLARRAAAAGLPPRFMPSPPPVQNEALAETQELAQTEQVLGVESALTRVVSETEQEVQRPSPLPPARTGNATGRVSCSGLAKRLVGKQAPPPGYVTPAPSRQSLPAARRRPRPEAGGAAASGIGCKIRVRGDGWGGGAGGYEGTVTEADDHSFTVIFQNDNKKWEETQVLRQYCDILERAENSPTHRRRTT